MKVPVLIGFADALAAIESAWCLADDGFEVHAFARRRTRPGQGRPALSRSGSIRVTAVTAPEDDALACAAELRVLARQAGAAVVLPLDDHALWLCDRVFGSDGPAGPAGPIGSPGSAGSSRAGAPGQPGGLTERDGAAVVVAGPTGRHAVLALDKRVQLRLAAAAGLPVPPTAAPGDPAAAGPGPWMVKPALAVEVRGGRLRRPAARIAASAGQVRAAAAAAGGPVLVQPLLGGTGEGIFGLAVSGSATALSAHRRIRMMNPRGSGSSACRSIPVPADVTGPVRELIAASGWHGLFMVELLRDAAGQPWFMELNGRAWGSMALARYRGYRYPSWAVRAALDARFRPTAPARPPDVTARHLGREIVHVGAVLAGGGAPRLGTVRAVLTVRRSDRWYNYRPGQRAVLLADTWATVSGQVTPGLSRALARAAGRRR